MIKGICHVCGEVITDGYRVDDEGFVHIGCDNRDFSTEYYRLKKQYDEMKQKEEDKITAPFRAEILRLTTELAEKERENEGLKAWKEAACRIVPPHFTIALCEEDDCKIDHCGGCLDAFIAAKVEVGK